MLHDCFLLGRLRLRHARTAVSRIMHIAGTDQTAQDGIGERAYQLYIAAFCAIALVLLWAALLDAVETSFALLGAAAAVSAFHLALLALTVAFVAASASGLRSSPLKCSHPDIAYVIASGLSMPSIALVALIVRVGACGIVGGLLGYVVGTGLASGLAGAVDPGSMALVAGFGAMAAAGVGWLAGAAVLVCKRKKASIVVGALAVALAALACGMSACALDPVQTLGGFGPFVLAGVFAAVTAGAVVSSVVLAALFDRAIVVEQNALFADMQPFGALSPIDPNTIRDYRRRRKLAMRPPRFRLPAGSGRRALVSRSALSLVRQYDGLPALFLQGLMAAPLGVFALSGAGGLIALLFWIQALLMFTQGIREETRAFGDDMRIRLMRDRLPFSALELLVFDTLPSFAVVSVLSSAAVAALALLAEVPLAWALALAFVLNAVYVLARGFDGVRFPLTGRPIGYEMGVLALVVCLGLVSLAGPSWWLVLAALALGAAFAAIVHFGVECV